MARATAARCCSPPESSAGRWWRRCARPKLERRSSTSDGGASPPESTSGISTFSRTVSRGRRLEGKFFTVDGFGKLFSRIATKSGVRRFHAHLLRHTWATNWMKQPGADLLSLQRQGGWKRLEMVERYSHAIPVKDRSALPNPMAESKVLRTAGRQSPENRPKSDARERASASFPPKALRGRRASRSDGRGKFGGQRGNRTPTAKGG
jgi:integrase-like protein